MCDSGNLIDLTGWDDFVQEKPKSESTHAESVCNEPYDPFDLLEKEACFKGLNIKNDIQNVESPAEDTPQQQQYADEDLNNETPPVTMTFLTKNIDCIKGNSKFNEPRQLSLQKQLVKLKAAKCMNTPEHQHSTRFVFDDLQMISAESPIKFIEDDSSPISTSACAPISELGDDTCSNSEFEARLKMVRIAMLGSPAKTETINNLTTEAKSKVGQLLLDLKTFSQHVEVTKRQQYNVLLESLSKALMPNPRQDNASQTTEDSPHIYTRQATFDLDLAKKNAAESVDGNQPVQAFPDAMTCSSATYDAESIASEKPASAIIESALPNKPDTYLTEVVNENLALQINELLERHKQHSSHDSSHNETKSGGGQTVILVVNSTAGNQLPSCIVHPTTAALSKANVDSASAGSIRRRSSSLSIHDKVKQDRARSLVKQSSGDSNCNNQCMPLKELSTVVDKSNGISSFRQRRNSFSIGLTAGKAAAARAMLDGRRQPLAINESIAKPNTHAKATIPIKRVVPMVKPTLPTSEAVHSVSSTRCSQGQDTPLPAKTKPGGKFFCTSTPMPQMRAQPRRSLRPLSSYSSSTGGTTNTRPTTSYGKKSA